MPEQQTCPDCGKLIKPDAYNYVLRNSKGSVVYFALERMSNGAFLGFRAECWHGHYPAPRIVTPPQDVWVEHLDKAKAVTTLVIP